ncbi:HypC/HybG/HupF family hydrogenase formation chaperone [Nonomuraea sp. NPDC048826]|uniref:HypC/HybG/HupF family hydrogenase formation chaperone n=1 Tax=Nonomuraea sp. NPDC048826 TaxID=3364347 RepID=UPI0037154AC8
MCLGVPGRIVARDGEMGTVDFDGLRREACLSYTPEAGPDDYVIVHVGFAISVLDEDEALRTIEVLRAIPGGLDEISR